MRFALGEDIAFDSTGALWLNTSNGIFKLLHWISCLSEVTFVFSASSHKFGFATDARVPAIKPFGWFVSFSTLQQCVSVRTVLDVRKSSALHAVVSNFGISFV